MPGQASWVLLGLRVEEVNFLQNRARLLESLDTLSTLAVTTRLIRLGNVQAVIKFLLEAHLPEVRVPQKLLETLFILKTLTEWCRRVWWTRRTPWISQKGYRRSWEKFLCSVEENPTREQLYQFYRLHGGIIVCTTGHRKGVLLNMTVKEVMQAQLDTNTGQRIIDVADQDTKDVFGHALIPLIKYV